MYDSSSIFTAMIDQDGTIWECSSTRKRQQVGVDIQKQEDYIKQIAEMQDTIDNYFKKLVELGVISLPKTPEQIAHEQAAQQAEINQSLLEAIQALKNEVGELRNNGHSRHGNESCIEPNGQISESIKQITTGNKGSNKSSDKAAS